MNKRSVESGVCNGTLSFTYDALGRKWRKQGAGETRDYCQGIEYKDGKLEAIYGPEGRLTAVYDQHGVSLTHYRAEYWLRDHLGNTRLAFSDENHDSSIDTYDNPNTPENESEVIQENHYYPFGLNHEGPWYGGIGPENKYLFNGIERVEELEINIDMAVFRSYDPAIGRWWQVDPLASLSFDWTTYRFGLNNPVVYTDPLGLFETREEARDFKKEKRIKGKVRRDGDDFYIQERGKGGGQYAFGTAASGYGTLHSTNNPSGANIFERASDGFWELMRSGDRWAQGDGGQKYAQNIADLNPLVSGANAYYGYTKGENIYGQKIGQGQSTLYAISAVPPMKIAAGLKVLGGTTLLSGIVPVSKKAFNLPVGLGGSKNALLSTVIAYKLGFRGSLGRKIPTLIGPSASSLETAIGRNAIPIGGSMIGAGYLIENISNK